MLGVLLTAALGVAAVHVVSARYQSRAVVLLLPPKDNTAHNPYLNLASLTGLSDVLDQAVTAELQDLGLTFTIASEQTTTAGPLILITGEAATPAGARKTAQYVIGLVPSTLRRLQSSAGVQPNAYITSIILNPVKRTIAVRTKQTRALILAVAAGLLLTMFSVVAADEVLVRRARRRTVPAPAPAPEGGGSTPTPPSGGGGAPTVPEPLRTPVASAAATDDDDDDSPPAPSTGGGPAWRLGPRRSEPAVTGARVSPWPVEKSAGDDLPEVTRRRR